jgi:hypothetical protein
MAYRYALLDPRPTPAAQAANDKIFADEISGEEDTDEYRCRCTRVVGIEVTVPALAAKCQRNIDPQHTGGRCDVAAIDLALSMTLPLDGSTLATIRPDLDSVGAMAILELRRSGRLRYADRSDLPGVASGWEVDGIECGIMDRIRAVSTADRFARGPWPGPRLLPSRADRWPAVQAGASDTRELAAIAACVADSGKGSLSMADRVAIMALWLQHGEEIPDLERYRSRVERERDEMIAALEEDMIDVRLRDRIETWADGSEHLLSSDDGVWQDVFDVTRFRSPIAVVTTEHRAATMLGYCLASVIVAENPRFRLGNGPEHRKVTICAWDAAYCDIRAALAELAAIEPGWGGSATIGGSPQGQSTRLPIETIVRIVAQHLVTKDRGIA